MSALNFYPLRNERAIVGAPVFQRLPNGLGVITAIHGYEPNNLAHTRARGWPDERCPLLLEIEWADGGREVILSSSLGDYDHHLEAEEAMQQARLKRRARLPIAGLPIHRP
jgi:hypothetical protein